MVVNKVMTQWIEDDTWFRGGETPSRLDLSLSKKPDIIGKVIYGWGIIGCRIGKSDHVMIECRGGEERKKEINKKMYSIWKED